MKKSIKSKPKRLQMVKTPTHKKDFFAWTRQQMTYLKNQEWNKLDAKHLFEELELLGGSERSALESHLTNMLMHLLKIKFQPNFHGKSWDLTVKNCKDQINWILKKNPSLKNYIKNCLDHCYNNSVYKAVMETGLDEKSFPKKCPWKIEEIL